MKTLLILLLVMLCGCGADIDTVEEVGEAEHALSFNGQAYGVAVYNGDGYARCTSGSVVDYCAYPANKQVLVKVVTGTFGGEELANVNAALDSILATINDTFGNAGWSAFRTTSSSADVILSNDANAGAPGAFGQIPSVLKTTCVLTSGTLAESPSIPLTHRVCGRWDARLDMQAIAQHAGTKPLADRPAWRYSDTAHAVAQAVLRPVGLGYAVGTTTGYSRLSLEPIDSAAGFLSAEHCSIQSFSTSPSGTITRLAGCP